MSFLLLNISSERFYLFVFSCLKNKYENLNQNGKMNIAMMNLCISLICPYFNLWSNLTSDIMPVTILTAIVTVAFQDLVETELCYTYV